MIRAMVRAFRMAGADGVELGPDGAPKAFRIWSSGDNPTDHGLHRFTDRSAELLMQEQAVRGNLYSIDVDHMSLDKTAPPECHLAVGWHRLEVRDGELWAVDVQWSAAVKAGLTADPPAWRYFSPAYDVDKKTREVVSYLNTALTNNPATWSVTALAKKGSPMRFAQILAAIMSGNADRRAEVERVLAGKKFESLMADLMGADEEKKTSAIAKLAAAFPDDDGDEDEKKKEPKKEKASKDDDDEKATKAAKDEADAKAAKAAKAAEDDPTTKAAIAATRELAATVATQGKELEGLKKEREDKAREAILATRKDLPEALVKTLRGMPLDLMKATVESLPKAAVDPVAASKVTGTRGSERGDGTGYGGERAARLPPEQHADLRERMTGEGPHRTIGWDKDKPNDLVFPQMTKDEARRILAARAKAGTDGPARNPANGGTSR